MSRIVEIGPFAQHIPDSQWGENYSERRYLSRMEYEILQMTGVSFSFERHLRLVRKKFPEVEMLEILDGGCGEGTALWDFKQLAAKLGIKIRTTGVTMDREHKKMMEAHVDEIVIGTVQNFFKQEDHTGQYHFILDYNGALASDSNASTKRCGEEIIPIYGRILASGGTALLNGGSLAKSLLWTNGFDVIWAARNCSLVRAT